MKVKIFAILIPILIIAAVILYTKNKESLSLTTGKCCEICKNGEAKYYSIVTKTDTCGESCIKPSEYWFFKLFEPGMLLAQDANPCHSFGYTNFSETVSHGFPITVKVDFYKKSESTN